MKTNDIGYKISKFIDEATLNPWKGLRERSFVQSKIPTESKLNAIVNLSESSTRLHRAEKIIPTKPDIRLEKIHALQQEIRTGAYRIDYDKVAENILGVLIHDIVR